MNSNFTAPSPVQALFWKEFRQIAPAVAAIFGCMLLAQLLAIGTAIFHPIQTEREGYLIIAVVISLISPFLVVLACCGMLIGHERQTNTWQWNSTLPVSWKHVLGVKLLITLLACTVILAVLLAVSLSTNLLIGTQEALGETAAIYAAPFAGLVLISSALVFFTSALVFKDTLMSMLIGMVALFAIQGAAYLVTEHYGPQILGWKQEANEFSHLQFGWSQSIIQSELLVISVLTAMCICVFRWRWGAGQLATFQLRRVSRAEPFVSNAIRTRYRAPSERYSLFRLFLKQSFGFRLATVIASLVAMAFASVSTAPFATSSEFLIVILAGTCAFLGVSTFEGLQRNDRMRFLADRGASPRTVWLNSTLLPAVASVTVVLCGITFVEDVSPLWFFFGWSFVCGMLSSICIVRPVVACVVAITLVIWSGFAQLFAMSCAWESRLYGDLAPQWLSINALMIWICLGVPLAIWFTLRSVRRWLINGKASFALALPWAAGLMLVPGLIAASTGFLWIPKTRVQAINPSNSNVRSHVGPELVVATELFPQRYQVTQQFVYHQHFDGMYRENVRSSAHNAYEDAIIGSKLSVYEPFPNAVFSSFSSPSEALSGGDQVIQREPLNEKQLAELELIIARLEELELQLAREPNEQSGNYVDVLQDHIMETTFLAIHLARMGKFEEALKAIQQNGRLRVLASGNSPVRSLAMSIAALETLEFYIDWYEFVPACDSQILLSALTPELEDPWNELSRMATANAAFYMDQVRGKNMDEPNSSNRYQAVTLLAHYFPPIRWRHERVLSFQLKAEQDRISRRDSTSAASLLDAGNRQKIGQLDRLYQRLRALVQSAQESELSDSSVETQPESGLQVDDEPQVDKQK